MGAAARRIVALAGGLALLAVGRGWTATGLDRHPFFAYGMEWFLKLTPGEIGFYLRYLSVGIFAAMFLTYALEPAADRLTHAGRRWARSPKVTAAALALAAACMTLIVSLVLLRDQVVTDDEYVYLFQSRLLLAGHAAAPAPALPEFLSNVFVTVRDGRWFGQYPPGQPIALIPGILLGWARAVPILMAAVNTLLSFAILRRVLGPSWGFAATLLLLTSPLFLLTGSTLLSHSTAYFALALATWGSLRATARDGIGAGVAAGAGLGLLLLTRPYTALTLGIFPAGLLAVAALRRRQRAVLAALAVSILAGLCLLLYNRAVTGNPFVTGYQAARGPSMIEFGFGPIVPGVHEHTPVQGLRNAALLAVRLHFWSWGWPLAVLPLALALLRVRRGDRAHESLAARVATAALLVGLLSYVPYWSIGVNDTGPVKTYEMLLPVALLSALGMRRAAERWGLRVVAAGAMASMATALAIFWPPQVQHLRELTAGIAEPWAEVRATVDPPAIVFVNSTQEQPARSWVYGRPNPRPDLSDPILYVADLGTSNVRFWERHRERRPYRLSVRDGRAVVEPLYRETP